MTRDPLDGQVHYVKIGDDPREFAINRGDAGLGSPTWMLDTADHWKQGPAQPQNGFVSTYLGDTKADASQWQRMMVGKPEEVTKDMTREEAQAHLDRLNAAPGDNPAARKALEEKINDTTQQPGAAGDLRGQGQTPLKGEASDEAFKLAGKEETRPFDTAEALEAHLRSDLGNKLIDGLQAQGLLKFENSAAEGRNARGMMTQPRFPNDLTAGDDTHATLYYDRLSPENASGTLMHELGEHFGLPRLLGIDRYKVLLSEVKEFGKSTDPEIQEAWNTVKDRYVLKPTDEGNAQFQGGSRANPLKYENTNNAQFLREVAAHLVETKPDLPFVRRLVNDIRVFFYTHFGTTLGTSVDASLIRGLAASALRKAAAGELKGQTAAAKPVPAAKSYAPMVAKRSDGFPPLYTQ